MGAEAGAVAQFRRRTAEHEALITLFGVILQCDSTRICMRSAIVAHQCDAGWLERTTGLSASSHCSVVRAAFRNDSEALGELLAGPDWP
jgi:hypothetical protein